MRNPLVSLLAASVATFTFAQLASAQVATDTLEVTATVTASCTINANPLAFGPYDPVAGTLVDAQTTLDVACAEGTISMITLGLGLNDTGGGLPDAPARNMTNGTDLLAYGLFQDVGRVTVWGNSPASGLEYIATSADPVVIDVFGRIPADQDVSAGLYADSVIATITF